MTNTHTHHAASQEKARYTAWLDVMTKRHRWKKGTVRLRDGADAPAMRRGCWAHQDKTKALSWACAEESAIAFDFSTAREVRLCAVLFDYVCDVTGNGVREATTLEEASRCVQALDVDYKTALDSPTHKPDFWRFEALPEDVQADVLAFLAAQQVDADEHAKEARPFDPALYGKRSLPSLQKAIETQGMDRHGGKWGPGVINGVAGALNGHAWAAEGIISQSAMADVDEPYSVHWDFFEAVDALPAPFGEVRQGKTFDPKTSRLAFDHGGVLLLLPTLFYCWIMRLFPDAVLVTSPGRNDRPVGVMVDGELKAVVMPFPTVGIAYKGEDALAPCRFAVAEGRFPKYGELQEEPEAEAPAPAPEGMAEFQATAADPYTVAPCSPPPATPAPPAALAHINDEDDETQKHLLAKAAPILDKGGWEALLDYCKDLAEPLLETMILRFRNALFAAGWTAPRPYHCPLVKGNATVTLASAILARPAYLLRLDGVERRLFDQALDLDPQALASRVDDLLSPDGPAPGSLTPHAPKPDASKPSSETTRAHSPLPAAPPQRPQCGHERGTPCDGPGLPGSSTPDSPAVTVRVRQARTPPGRYTGPIRSLTVPLPCRASLMRGALPGWQARPPTGEAYTARIHPPNHPPPRRSPPWPKTSACRYTPRILSTPPLPPRRTSGNHNA